MSNDFTADFQAIEPLQLAPSRPIKAGDSGTHQGIVDLAQNHNHLIAYHRPTIVLNYSKNLSTVSTSFEIIHAFRQRILTDASGFVVTVYASNASGSETGTLRVQLRSDSAVYTADETVPVSTPEYTAINISVGLDSDQAIDTIEVLAKTSNAAAPVKIHAVMVLPSSPATSTIPNGLTPTGIAPIDWQEECDQDSPLTTYLANELNNGCSKLHRQRMATVVSWSDDLRSNDLERRDATYATALLIWFDTDHGSNRLRWSLHAHKSGGTAKIRLRTGHMVANDIDPVEVLVTSTAWAEPYTAAVIDSSDSTEITTAAEKAVDYLEVSIQGDGTETCYLHTFSAWQKDIL